MFLWLVLGCEETKIDYSKVWGWVAVQESTVPCDLHNEWCGPVRARFAVAPSYSHSLYHQRVKLFCREVEKSGDCSFYAECGVPSSDRRSCYNSCASDEECLGSQCVKLPLALDAGKITLSGLKKDIAMSMDDAGKYQAELAPETDLFDAGSPISAQAAGSDLEAFSLQAFGVEDIKGYPETVVLGSGKDISVAWTPAQTGSRVELILIAGWHYPFLPGGAILCDGEDAQGSFSISSALIGKFLEAGAALPYAHGLIGRYTRGTTQISGGQEIELFVSSLRSVAINLQ